MLMYIMFGGAVFQMLEQENDVQISREYLAEWEALSATIDGSISEESERKFTLDKAPPGFNASTLNETVRARRKSAADMFDHSWFDAVSDQLWSTQQHRRGLDGEKRSPKFDKIDPQADEVGMDDEADEAVISPDAAGWPPTQRFKRSTATDTSARWTEKSQHWLNRGCNAPYTATWTNKSTWGTDDEALGKVACCHKENSYADDHWTNLAGEITTSTDHHEPAREHWWGARRRTPSVSSR